MSFLHYKYKPKKINEIMYNIDLKDKLEICAKKTDIFSMILYGPEGIGKKTLLHCYLNQYFNNDNSVYNLSTIDFVLSNNYKVYYKTSSRHFQIYFTENPKNNIYIIYELINSLLRYKSVTNNYLIIMIYNIDRLQDNIIHLKYISEKYPCVVFLCTTSKHISISLPFIQLKCNRLCYIDLLKITVKINKYENLKLSNKEIKIIINTSFNNLHNLFNILQSIKLDQGYINSISNNIDLIDNIIVTLLKKDVHDFPQIKTILNNILIHNTYSLEYVIYYIFSKILYHISNKSEFIYETAQLSENLIINNDIKAIILLDTYIFYIYKML